MNWISVILGCYIITLIHNHKGSPRIKLLLFLRLSVQVGSNSNINRENIDAGNFELWHEYIEWIKSEVFIFSPAGNACSLMNWQYNSSYCLVWLGNEVFNHKILLQKTLPLIDYPRPLHLYASLPQAKFLYKFSLGGKKFMTSTHQKFDWNLMLLYHCVDEYFESCDAYKITFITEPFLHVNSTPKNPGKFHTKALILPVNTLEIVELIEWMVWQDCHHQGWGFNVVCEENGNKSILNIVEMVWCMCLHMAV